jgi:uncharacterized protein YkwD
MVPSPVDEYRNHLQYTRRVAVLNTPCVEPQLTAIAQNHAEWMAKIGYIYHQLGYVVLPTGWWSAGEIVGMGPDLATIHRAFLASWGHSTVIHDRRWTHMGIGVAQAGGTYYVSVLFVAHQYWCGVW